MKTRKEQFSVAFSPDIIVELKKRADTEDISVAHVIRRIIKKELRKEDKP